MNFLVLLRKLDSCILPSKNGLKQCLFTNTRSTKRCFSVSPLLSESPSSPGSKISSQKNSEGICFVPFEEMVFFRRSQARRSLIIEIDKTERIMPLKKLCSKYGVVNDLFFYTNPLKKKMVIIEFEKQLSMFDVLNEMVKSSNGMRVASVYPFLSIDQQFFSHTSHKHEEISHYNGDSNLPLTEQIVFSELINCSDVSDQIKTFYEKRRFQDLDIRLRFIACNKIEHLLPKFLHGVYYAIPFGSSLNMFGHCFSDLDVCLNYYSRDEEQILKTPLCSTIKFESGKERCKAFLKLLYQTMKYDSHFSKMVPILEARVPIIKFVENFTGLECDLTFQNDDAIPMTELMYILSKCDARVSPLVFVVKYWGKLKKINCKLKPGRGISNFSLSVLTLYYLMNTSPPIIPSIQELLKFNGIRDSILRMSSIKILPKSKNNQDLETLLHEFFKFYSNFTFTRKKISLLTGTRSATKENFAINFENPIETLINVTRNTSKEDVEHFKYCCRTASHIMDTHSEKQMKTQNPWGLTTVFHHPDNRRLDVMNYLQSKPNSKGKISH